VTWWKAGHYSCRRRSYLGSRRKACSPTRAVDASRRTLCELKSRPLSLGWLEIGNKPRYSSEFKPAGSSQSLASGRACLVFGSVGCDNGFPLQRRSGRRKCDPGPPNKSLKPTDPPPGWWQDPCASRRARPPPPPPPPAPPARHGGPPPPLRRAGGLTQALGGPRFRWDHIPLVYSKSRSPPTLVRPERRRGILQSQPSGPRNRATATNDPP
jgi:hypothetical protein